MDKKYSEIVYFNRRVSAAYDEGINQPYLHSSTFLNTFAKQCSPLTSKTRSLKTFTRQTSERSLGCVFTLRVLGDYLTHAFFQSKQILARVNL